MTLSSHRETTLQPAEDPKISVHDATKTLYERGFVKNLSNSQWISDVLTQHGFDPVDIGHLVSFFQDYLTRTTRAELIAIYDKKISTEVFEAATNILKKATSESMESLHN